MTRGFKKIGWGFDFRTMQINTTQKKFRISCAYFFVLSTSNSFRLRKHLQIKLTFSEDISYITIPNFCEKQLIPNGSTLIIIVQKPLFDPKNTFFYFMF